MTPHPAVRRRRPHRRTIMIAVVAVVLSGIGIIGISNALAATAGPITGFGGKCVDVAASRTANGTAIQLYTCNGTNAQKWTVGNSDNSIQALGKCMDVTGSSTANGAKVQLYSCNGSNAQKWTATNGQLINPNSGKCLDATGSSSANGTRLQIWSCGTGANQKWTLPAATPTPTTPSATPSTTPSATPSATPSTPTNTAFPVRAAFYYPWYPENFLGSGGTKYMPSAGHYNGDDPAVIDRQIADMQYGGLQAGIASWWGQGTREDRRLALLMAEATRLNFSWSAYYEDEGFGDPDVATLSADLAYLKKYSDSPTWLHVGGKPVIFAYGDGADACSMVTRWKQANTYGYYVVLKVFGGYRSCADQPQGWHQYGPGTNIDVQTGYSVAVSPGFFLNTATTPLLARDVNRFRADVTTMAQSKAPFQLITTYNEWGEGTSVESTTDWPSASGHGQYMDVLHEVFAAYPR